MLIYRIDYRKEDRDTKHLFVVSNSLLNALACSVNILGTTDSIQSIYRINEPDDCVLIDIRNTTESAKR